jgi:hypothetical protein
MFRRRWPAYSAALLLAVGVACLIALLIKAPGDDSSAVATHTPRRAAATVAMPAKALSASSGAARTS